MMDRNRPRDNTELLAALAERLQEDQQYMAYALCAYQRHTGLDDEALARELGTSLEMIVRLALCKRPDVKSASFGKDLRELSNYTLADEKALSQVIQRCFNMDRGSVPEAWPPVGVSPPAIRRRLWRPSAEWLASAFTRQALVFSCSLALVLLVWGVLLWRQSVQRPQPELVALAPKADPHPVASSMPSSDGITPSASDSRDVPGSSRGRGPSQVQSRRQRLSDKALTVNLDGPGTLRDAGEPGTRERIVKLSRSRTNLIFRLPEGSRRGDYRVSIESTVDAYSPPLFSTTSTSGGGFLKAVVDTREILPGAYRLCVRRESKELELPDCVLLRIDRARSDNHQVR